MTRLTTNVDISRHSADDTTSQNRQTVDGFSLTCQRPSPPLDKLPSANWLQVPETAGCERPVDFDANSLAIAMITAPRRRPTLEMSLQSIRQGQFEQVIHLFSEPQTLSENWARERVVVHRNPHRFGCYPNWLQAAQWLLTSSDRPFLMLCEDDGIYCRALPPHFTTD